MSYAGDVSVEDAWARLRGDSAALMIDVRTRAEWSYVGLPDLAQTGKKLALVEWQTFPGGEANPSFVDNVKALGAPPDAPLFFICRSGARSRSAAIALTATGYTQCFNVAGGFEGDQDENGHRGTVGGWKAAGLPWEQS
jgi:rhodanese-related sulfurtransferase